MSGCITKTININKTVLSIDFHASKVLATDAVSCL